MRLLSLFLFFASLALTAEKSLTLLFAGSSSILSSEASHIS
jgi:hypothetical protein